MSPVTWVALAVGVGAVLVWSASRATASVREGVTFVRWMLAVFVAFLILASIPILAGR